LSSGCGYGSFDFGGPDSRQLFRTLSAEPVTSWRET
jgi:hypothetical protein